MLVPRDTGRCLWVPRNKVLELVYIEYNSFKQIKKLKIIKCHLISKLIIAVHSKNINLNVVFSYKAVVIGC